MAPRVEDLLDPAYLEGLATLELTEVRNRRSVCTEVEVTLSYLRRMVQGRLDIALAERHRRQEGDTDGDLASLIEMLPDILSDKLHAPGFGRLPTIMAPNEVVLREATSALDAIAPADRMGVLPDVPDAEIEAMVEGLKTMETGVSRQRRQLHDVLDRLQEEVIRRYQTGEANVDSLLR